MNKPSLFLPSGPRVPLPAEASDTKVVCTRPRVAHRPQNLLSWFLPSGLCAELLFTREISGSQVWSRIRQRWKIPSPALSLPSHCREHLGAGALVRDSLPQLPWRAGQCPGSPYTPRSSLTFGSTGRGKGPGPGPSTTPTKAAQGLANVSC